MKPDLPDILQHSHDMGLYTIIITNGTYLPENAEKIAGTVDLTWVSLDYNSKYHMKCEVKKRTLKRQWEIILNSYDFIDNLTNRIQKLEAKSNVWRKVFFGII